MAGEVRPLEKGQVRKASRGCLVPRPRDASRECRAEVQDPGRPAEGAPGTDLRHLPMCWPLGFHPRVILGKRRGLWLHTPPSPPELLSLGGEERRSMRWGWGGVGQSVLFLPFSFSLARQCLVSVSILCLQVVTSEPPPEMGPATCPALGVLPGD